MRNDINIMPELPEVEITLRGIKLPKKSLAPSFATLALDGRYNLILIK